MDVSYHAQACCFGFETGMTQKPTDIDVPIRRDILNQMTPFQEIHSLDEFNQNARTHVRRLKRTGRPEVLTVNGKPAVVIQDAGSYQRLLDAVEKAEAIAGIKRGLVSMERGEGEAAKTVFSRLRRKYKIPADA